MFIGNNFKMQKKQGSSNNFLNVIVYAFVFYLVISVIFNIVNQNKAKQAEELLIQQKINVCSGHTKTSNIVANRCFVALMKENDSYLVKFHYANFLFNSGYYITAKKYYGLVVSDSTTSKKILKIANDKLISIDGIVNKKNVSNNSQQKSTEIQYQNNKVSVSQDKNFDNYDNKRAEYQHNNDSVEPVANKRKTTDATNIQNNQQYEDEVQYRQYQPEQKPKFKYAHNRLLRWIDPTTLKVNIIDPTHRKIYIKEAFEIWDSQLGKDINFVYTDNLKEAHIVVKFSNNEFKCGADTIGCTQHNVHYEADNPNLKLIDKSIILLRSHKDDGTQYSNSEITAITLHEIGHALGIEGHSDNKQDIMYPNTDGELYKKAQISHRDIAWIQKIYEDK